MGMEALFCCFRSFGPKITALTGLGASVLSFAFLIWGVVDLWFKRKGVEVIYYITFVLVIFISNRICTIIPLFNYERIKDN